VSVYHGYTDLPEVSRGCVAALGNFDGVHRGHRAVIQTACAFAKTLDAPAPGRCSARIRVRSSRRMRRPFC
jgi:riboflavin kinase/FMN adenylyltransferase